MAAIERIRDRFEQIGTSIAEGWRRLTDAAGHAVTRFTPSHRASDEEARDLDRRNVGWGLLPVEVFDQNAHIEVRLEAPGLEREDFEVEVHGDELRLAGEKRVQSRHQEGEYHVAECAYGRFARLIPLPTPVEADSAKASYRNGVLTVTLKKAGGARRRRIEIDGA
ncbi:Hsp20/alpha crystallin family protein [Guyparkeria hydrothermalis]|uniref:Hsp20/alpha crystallin family protein n=1 Tax=Guyparkeria hydrothermalis TaxID=923 RepID=UPI00201FC85A|nr:Hsp20/alpha crystallin family protein [Guyparkeria hydrothermalis]MCL7744182.1 Hsp20/alpha crystallin family protein [Guyparkeria hydrothermalis]